MNAPAVAVSDLTHRYGERRALDGLSLSIDAGEIFALLGPNGGGKTTLFRLLSTLIPLQQGTAQVLGCDLRTAAHEARRRMGVVFQAPSLDRKLTVAENLTQQGRLYGLSGQELRQRSDVLLRHFGLAERATDRVETLSGGLRRRVELAKGLLHRPRLLLLDEPSTGLDPGARSDLWGYLTSLRAEHSTTVVVTTHLLEEAEKADRLAILHQGRLVALDTPQRLRATVGGDTITIEADRPQELAAEITQRFAVECQIVDGAVVLRQDEGHRWIARLVEGFPAGRVRSVKYGQPTLEDVFIARTGRRFRDEEDATPALEKSHGRR